MPEVPAGWGWIILLALLPLILSAATAFAKSSVLFGALRVGLGAEALLPLPAMLALSVVVAAIVMTPTAEGIFAGIAEQGGPEAVIAGGLQAWLAALEPWREFLVRHADPDEVRFFAELGGRSVEHPLVVVPAFLVTELGEALAMAVVVLVPFVAVDLLVGHGLTLLGLGQLPPALVSLPLKLLLFLAVDGWDIVVGGLIQGYR